MMPHAGVLEMMGQVGFVTWPEAQREGQAVRRERLVFPPVFLSRANASTQYTALERTLEPLSFTKFLGLCTRVRFVVLSLGADLARSNARLKLEVGARSSSTMRRREGQARVLGGCSWWMGSA